MNRLHHARKTSREDNIKDLVHYHMESSDPYIVSLMRFKRRKPTPLTPEMVNLLKVDPVKAAAAAAAAAAATEARVAEDGDDSDSDFYLED